MSHPNQNKQQPEAANTTSTESHKSNMNVNATAWSAASKDFIPSSNSMAQPFQAANGPNQFNTQAGTFTPYGQPPIQQNFNYNAQAFQPQSFQNSQMMNSLPRDGQSHQLGSQPMPPPPAAQPQGSNIAPPPMNTGGLNSIYPPSQPNHQWPNQMYQPPAPTAFTPSNVNSASFAPTYGRGFNAPQPQPQPQPAPIGSNQYMPQGQMGGQSYGGYYNPNSYNTNNNQNLFNSEGQYGGGNRPIALYNQSQGGAQTSHHKKPYNKGGNQHYTGAPAQQYKPKPNQHNQNTGTMKKNSFAGFEAPSDFNPNMNNYKQRNIELTQPSVQPAAANGTTKASMPDWSKLIKQLPKTMPGLKKRDILKEALEKHEIKEEAEVQSFRKLVQLLKDSKEGKEVKIEEETAKDDQDDIKEETAEKEDDAAKEEAQKKAEEALPPRRKGSIHLKLFQKVAELCLCSTERETKANAHCLNMHIVERKVNRELDGKVHGGFNKKVTKYKNNDQKGHKGKYNNNYQSDTPWIQKDSDEKQKLKQQAALIKKKLGQDRSADKKIALILNIISPENCTKKMKELRQFLFPDFKTKDEVFQEDIDYDESVHQLTDDNLDTVTLDTIVKNIFRKAQDEKLFCIFYGQICEELIHLELSLRGMDQSRQNLKWSKFRKSLFEVCKDCFEKFFDAEERAKQTKDLESSIRFKLKLFGNIEFVGELYRRKILPEATLVSVFESLLGISDTNDTADDLVIEGAVNLMNKVGQTLEQNVKNAGERKKDDKLKSFKKILNRFQELVNTDGDEVISNRVKLLIKNMFSNKDSGWLKTQDLNQGPKTKSQVQKEVEDKHLKEQQARNEGRDRRGYNDYQNDGRRNDRGHRKGDGYGNAPQGKQKYQPKGGEHTYGDGKREAKQNDGGRDDGKHGGKRGQQQPEEKVEYEEIDDLEMSGSLKKNFEQYCIDYNTAMEAEEEGEEVNADEKAANKRPDYELYTTLKQVNGKTNDQIVCSLLSSVFDEETKKVEQHLARYFELLIGDNILKSRDINKGLSRFGELLPELVLDCPQIHKYLMDCMIRPLLKKNMMQLKHITWKVEEPKKDGDEDDDIIFGTNPYFKLLALILLDLKKAETSKRTWQDVVNCFDKELKWRTITDEKFKNIEDPDDLWTEIKDELEDEVAASIILPLLKNNKKQVQEALKDAK